MNDSRLPDHAAIPILMEPVEGAAAPGAHGRALGREDQQPLFDDIPPAAAPERRRAPAPSQADRLRAAREMLRARAPAIVEEVAAAHQKQLADVLRERLRRELNDLLDDLAGPLSPP
ncbi:MAG: hypothetical protein ACLGHJ_08705 [Gammaproteobacteria bacterium]